MNNSILVTRGRIALLLGACRSSARFLRGIRVNLLPTCGCEPRLAFTDGEPLMSLIHPTAVIDAAADIAPTASIGAYCVIESGVRIGPDTVIAPMCHILQHTTIGAHCQIHTGTVIGGVPQDRAYTGEVSGCEIGDSTVVREHVTIHRGTAPGSITRIGKRCLLMVGSHVGHNCTLEDDVTLVNGTLLGGHVHIGARAILSGHVAVHQFVRIGEGAMVGVLARITRDVLPFFTVTGSGVNVGLNRIGMRRMGIVGCDIDQAHEAFRVLCRENHSLPVAREMLKGKLSGRVGLSILAFLDFDSRRGFHLRSCLSRRRLNASPDGTITQ